MTRISLPCRLHTDVVLDSNVATDSPPLVSRPTRKSPVVARTRSSRAKAASKDGPVPNTIYKSDGSGRKKSCHRQRTPHSSSPRYAYRPPSTALDVGLWFLFLV